MTTKNASSAATTPPQNKCRWRALGPYRPAARRASIKAASYSSDEENGQANAEPAYSASSARRSGRDETRATDMAGSYVTRGKRILAAPGSGHADVTRLCYRL